MRSLSVEIAGEEILLLAEKAAFWPRERTLFAADLHLGKAAAFRRAGIPIPHGTTETDLERLGGVLDETSAERLVILGDLLHSAAGRAEKTFDEVSDWRSLRHALDVVLVSGNHDAHSGPLPSRWSFRLAGEAFDAGPFLCAHDAPETERFVFHGHVHPKVEIRNGSRGGRSFPCFVLGTQSLVFPAFGTFTGGHRVPLQRGVCHFPVIDGAIYRLAHQRI